MAHEYTKRLGRLSFRLFARPSFLEGMARVVDLGQSLQVWNEDQSPAAADRRATLTDWHATGEDIQAAIDTYGRDHQEVRT